MYFIDHPYLFKFFCVVLSLLYSLKGEAQAFQSELNQYMSQGVHVAIVDLKTKRQVYGFDDVALVKPASVMKLFTSYAALKTLGAEYRFSTKLMSYGQKNDKPEILWLVGGGDPSFTTEQLWVLARAVKRAGISEIGQLILDPSMFQNISLRQGQRAYQAANSGLAFNFNAVTFEVCPSVVGSNALMRQEPWEYTTRQTGNISTVNGKVQQFSITEMPAQFGTVVYKLSGTIGADSGCKEIYRSVSNPEAYLADTFRGFLNELGIRVGDGFKVTPVVSSAKLLFSINSKALSQIVEDMNMYSNNFIAEQLLVSLDPSIKSKRREVGLVQLNNLVRQFGCQRCRVVDASGLSHQNKISAKSLVNLLVTAWNDRDIAPEFVKSLPVGGKSGTLKSRNLNFSNWIVRAKTGTIDGVSALAGYILGNEKKYAFVILQNSGLLAKHSLEENIVNVVIRNN